MTVVPGTKLGRYEIRAKIGEGGMGEVYLAADTELGRSVALKILPLEVAADQRRISRFVQEARAASGLNHPHILTIYEIGQSNYGQFIASEFIDGATLRKNLWHAPIRIRQALEIAIQTADALSAAHEVGIVHRDIKPENIMVRRRDDYVKVLDFGLAKLTEPHTGKVDTEAPTRPAVHTEPGVIMGTTPYMSPEQARGLQVDARTDIFSLGVLIYEMVTSRLPFEGSSANEILASILSDKEPPPLARYSHQVPPELERIVEKALRKDREERYQVMKDLLLDLKSLKHHLEFEAELERSQAPETGSGQMTSSSAGASDSAALLVGNHIRRNFMIALTVLTIVAAGLVYVYYYSRPAKAIDSVAVLPLVNASSDPNTEYLCDGITESIISNLSQLPQLRVMARATVFRFKGKEIDPQEVGRQLGVKALFMGRLMQQGERLIIRAELVNVADGTQLWGAEYDRKLSDVLALQQEISREISGKLRLKLTSDEQKRLTVHDTSNTEAYRLYLLGMFHWNKFTEEGAKKSIEYFNQALEKDPNYALPYTGLAGAYGILGQINLPPREAIPKSKAYVDKALALDDTLAEAHLGLAANNFFYDWDWKAAEQEFKRAIELNPSLAQAHDLYGQYLTTMGRFDEAVVALNRSLEMDPLAPLHPQNLGLVYYYARRYDLTVSESQKALDLDPNFFFAAVQIGWAYGQQGRYQEAISALLKSRGLPSGFAMATSELGYVYARSGRKAETQKMVEELKDKASHEYIDPYFIAIIYVGLGERGQTFDWLDEAYEARSNFLPWVKVEPKFDSLRSDPRYADLVRRLGLRP